VPGTNAGLPRLSQLLLLFLQQPLTVLMKQTRQAVCACKQSIYLYYLDVYVCINSNVVKSMEMKYILLTHVYIGEVYHKNQGENAINNQYCTWLGYLGPCLFYVTLPKVNKASIAHRDMWNSTFTVSTVPNRNFRHSSLILKLWCQIKTEVWRVNEPKCTNHWSNLWYLVFYLVGFKVNFW